MRKVAAYAAIIIGTLIAAELLARIWAWQPALFDGPVDDGMGPLRYLYSSSSLGDLVPDQNGLWVSWLHRPFHVQTNSIGFRNAEEPSDDAFQILAVGDSMTFGIYVANDDTWPAWS